jgi:hypothetical protein
MLLQRHNISIGVYERKAVPFFYHSEGIEGSLLKVEEDQERNQFIEFYDDENDK